MQSLLFKAVALPLIGLVITIVFVFLTFPEDKVQILVQKQFEKALDNEYRVEAVEFDLGFGGVEMENITLTPRFEIEDEFAEAAGQSQGGPATGDGETLADKYFCPQRVEAAPMLIDRIAVDPSWLSLIGGSPEAEFTVETAGGSMTGALTSAEEGGQSLTASLQTINLARFTWLRNKLGIHLTGILGGDIDVVMAEAGLAEGGIDLKLGNVVLCPKTFMMGKPNPIPFTLPVTRFGNVGGTIEVSGPQRLEFKGFEGEGEDADLKVDGYIQMANERFPKGNYDIRIKLKPDQKWLRDNQLEAVLYNMCRRFDDGSIQIVISGQAGQTKHDCVRNPQGNRPPQRTQVQPTRAAPPPSNVAPAQKTPAPAPRQERQVFGNAKLEPIRPVNAAELKGKVDPVPEAKRREILGTVGRKRR